MKNKQNPIKAYIGYNLLEAESSLGKQIIKKAEIYEVSIASKDIDKLQEVCDVEADRLEADEILTNHFWNNPIVNIDHDYARPPIGKVIALKVLKKKIKLRIHIAPWFLDTLNICPKNNVN